MKEFNFLKAIIQEEVDFQTQLSEGKNQKEEVQERASKLREQAEQLLVERGEEHQTGGFRIDIRKWENFQFRATPPVGLELNGEKIVILVTEDPKMGLVDKLPFIKGISVYIGSDKIGNQGGKVKIFGIKEEKGKTHVRNWRWNQATIEQMEMASELLSFIEHSLAEKVVPTPEA